MRIHTFYTDYAEGDEGNFQEFEIAGFEGSFKVTGMGLGKFDEFGAAQDGDAEERFFHDANGAVQLGIAPKGQRPRFMIAHNKFGLMRPRNKGAGEVLTVRVQGQNGGYVEIMTFDASTVQIVG